VQSTVKLKPRWVKSCKGGEPHGLPKWCWNLHYFSLKFLDHLQKGPKEVDWMTRTVLQGLITVSQLKREQDPHGEKKKKRKMGEFKPRGKRFW